MSCEKHGYTNNVYCPVCDLEKVNAMTTFPPSPAQGETAGVSEAPLCLCKTPWLHLCPEHVPCTANPYARVRMLAYAVLNARQQLADLRKELGQPVPLSEWQKMEQQLAEMRGALSDARNRFANMADEAYATRNAKAVYDAAKGWVARSQVDAQLGRDACEAALAPTYPDPVRSAGEAVPERGKCETCFAPISNPRKDCAECAARMDCAQPSLGELTQCDGEDSYE